MRFAAIVLFAWSAFAGIERGDIAVVTRDFGIIVYSADGRMKFAYAGISQVGYDKNGDLFALGNSGRGLLRFDANYTLVQAVTVDPSISLTVSEAGTVNVLTSGQMMRVYSPDLTLRGEFEFPTFSLSIDIASNECTMLSLSSFSVNRFDVCSKRSIPTPFANFEAARALGDGGFVTASGFDFEFFDANGKNVRLLQRITPFVFALSFDPDPHFLWLLTTEGLQKIDISTGALLQTLPVTGSSFAIAGETRPSSSDILVKGRRESVRHGRH